MRGFDPARHEGLRSDSQGPMLPEPIRVRAPSAWPMPSTDAGSFDARSRSPRPIPRGLQAALLEPNDGDTIAIRTTDFCYQTILTSTHDSCCYPRQQVFEACCVDHPPVTFTDESRVSRRPTRFDVPFRDHASVLFNA